MAGAGQRGPRERPTQAEGTERGPRQSESPCVMRNMGSAFAIAMQVIGFAAAARSGAVWIAAPRWVERNAAAAGQPASAAYAATTSLRRLALIGSTTSSMSVKAKSLPLNRSGSSRSRARA